MGRRAQKKQTEARAPKTRGGWGWVPLVIAVVVTLVYLWLAVDTLRPFVDNVNVRTAKGDDWLTYKQYALSIVHDGWEIPRIKGNYQRPGGFLYNYFIAGIFIVFGENSNWVYIAQAGMLGLSVLLMALAFRGNLSTAMMSLYVLLLSIVLLFDVMRFFTLKLLSENLLLFLLPLFFLLLLRGFERDSARLLALAGLVLGLAVLARPNVILMGPASATLVVLYRRSRRGVAMAGLLFATFVLALTPMLARNYAVTQRVSFRALSYTGDWLLPKVDLAAPLSAGKLWEAAVVSGQYYLDRTLYVMGYLPAHQPQYATRWHWLVMWALAAAAIAGMIRRRRLRG
ncbi:MAG TPA: glycosyltransferase family 39 protein [Thermoanaerobaculia bacterium]|nr:glycosyltransferase family 39 protein [Thermoanaerobaculia bacterium]